MLFVDPQPLQVDVIRLPVGSIWSNPSVTLLLGFLLGLLAEPIKKKTTEFIEKRALMRALCNELGWYLAETERVYSKFSNNQDATTPSRFAAFLEYEQKWPREFSNAGRFASVKELVEEAKREGRDKRYSWKEHAVLEGPKGNRIYRAYKKRRSLSLNNKPEMFPFPVVSVPGALSRLLHFRRVQKARAAIAKELGINLGHAEAGASVFKFDYWNHYRSYDLFIRETLIESDNGLLNFVSNFEGLTSYYGGPSVSEEVKGYAQELKGSPMWRAIYKQFRAHRRVEGEPFVTLSN